MKTPFALLTLIAALGACGSPVSPPVIEPVDTTGLRLGIESGNNQRNTAGNSRKLGDAVIGRLVRKPSGGVTFATTGTVVVGSPIVGAVVCAVSIDAGRPLTPFVPCTNTDSTGHATFYFTTGSTAGESRAEIRGVINNTPSVFDTATAIVLPDSATSVNTRLTGQRDLGNRTIGDTIQLSTEITRVRDGFGNDVTEWTADYSFSSDSIVGSTFSGAWPAKTASGLKPVVPSGARTLFIQIGKVRIWFKLRAN